MKKELYYIDCITNLHVGAGDVNYNIIDKEVEKDPVTGNPIVHASGIKGALRDWAKKVGGYDENKIAQIFGAPCASEATETAGTHSYFNAQLICRPMRACGSFASVKVTTLDVLRNFVETTMAFGFDIGINLGDLVEANFDFGDCEFLASVSGITTIEGEKVKVIADKTVVNKIRNIIGGEFAIVKEFSKYELPVVARNNLQMKSGGLWYEEYVPYGSRFYIIVLSESDAIEAIPGTEDFIQIGGNSSIGYGFCKFKVFRKGE